MMNYFKLLKHHKLKLCRGLSASISDVVSPSRKTFPVITAQEFMSHSEDPTSTVHFNSQNRHKKLGAIYAESFGPDVFAIFIADPSMCRQLLQREGPYPQHAVPHSWKVYNERFGVERGLFFLDGPEWWRLRQKMNPLLMKDSAVKRIASMGNPVTQKLLNEMEIEMKEKGDSVYEITDFVKRLHHSSVQTMLAGLYGNLFFDSVVQDNFDIARLIANVQTMFEASARLQVISSEEAAENKNSDWIRFQAAADEALKAVSELTQSLIGKSSTGLVHLMQTSGFSDDEICRLASDFLIASADTTSYTILWCLHLLAMNTEKQEIARQEVQNLIGDHLNSSELTYIRWCNKEAMRLFPVAPFVTRILAEPLEIDGYTLPSGQLILLSTYVMGRDEKFFENPEQFWPERWRRLSPTRLLGVSKEASYATLPFGHGIRSCIGKRLAEHQVASFIARTLERFKLTSLNHKEVQMTMRLIGLPDDTIRIGISSVNGSK